jgi:polysaccharide deacetylase 2 family uncharacterized protein YibQ
MATLAAFLVVAGASGAIQMFGDPHAGGPRRNIALQPSNAEAAPHVSFGEVAEAGTALPPGFDITPVDQLPVFDEPGEGSGEVRITVAGQDEAAARRPTAPAVAPLPRAPLPGLTEAGPLGPLPIVARDGRASYPAYVRRFQGDAAKPKIAIIVGGLGFNARATTQAIEELPADVTLSFVPYASGLQDWINRARARGHEVMLELPMEPFDPQADDTGPQTLLTSAEPAANVQRLENLLSRGTGYFGVTNYQGARFAASAPASQPIARELKRRGLAFIGAGLGVRTAFSVEASRAGMPNTSADRIIDARREAEAIDEQLLNLEALALQNGSAIGSGFAYPVTMLQVAEWAREVNARGYALAPASAVLALRQQRR